MPNKPFRKCFKSKIAAGLVVLAFATGCSSSKAPEPSPLAIALPPAPVDYVATVRQSTMSGYPAATIGTAFESAFRDFHWQSSINSEGVRVVNFTGRLPVNLRQGCLAPNKPAAAPVCSQDAKVSFQWTFVPNSGLFHLSYVDPDPWPPAYRSTRDMLLFIYG
jgi:hypothetical protein